MGLRTIIMCLSIKSRAFSIWGGVGGRRRKQPSPQVLFLFVFFLPSEKQDPLYVCLYTTAVPEIPEAGSKRQQDVTTRSSCHWLFLEQPTPHFGSHGLVNLQCSSQTYILVLNGHHSPQKQANCFLHQAAHALRMSRADAQPRAHCSTQALHNSMCFICVSKIFIHSASLYLPELPTFTFRPFHTKAAPNSFLWPLYASCVARNSLAAFHLTS